MPVSDPFLARYHPHSVVLQHESGPRLVCTRRKEVYGSPSDPIAFDIGNGGAGFTGILQKLSEAYIEHRGGGIRIGWIPNHSRHSQAALLADILQVALTYEPEYEDMTVKEGWARKECRAFNDHFVVIGDAANVAGLEPDDDAVSAFRKISGTYSSLPGTIGFCTRGDGSATFAKELEIWRQTGLKAMGAAWMKTHVTTPFGALEEASQDGVYILSDRATYLTFKHRNPGNNLRCFVEGGPLLLNPCSAMINLKSPPDIEARLFAEWLHDGEAQRIVERFGGDWTGTELPLFSPAAQADLVPAERLPGRI